MIYEVKDIELDYSKIENPKGEYTAKLKIMITGMEGDIVPYHVKHPRPTILILPGGGYDFTAQREAEPVATHFLAAGFNVCILDYSVRTVQFPIALLESLTAVKYIREHCEAWYGDPNKIYVCGFSAGGHLAASVGVFWNREVATDYFGDTEICKPNGLILSYPVITSEKEFTHGGSFHRLLGEKEFDPEARNFQSLELQVTKNTPPTFIWSSFEDAAVPCESTLRFANALRAADVPFELHIFEKGPHGTATGSTDSCWQEHRVHHWLPLACEWVKDTRFQRS